MAKEPKAAKAQPDAASEAARLINEALAKRPLNAPDLERADYAGKMSPSARVELWANRLMEELKKQRDWFSEEHAQLSLECGRLREKERELDKIKSSLSRDRWEAVVALIAAGLGAGLISTFPFASQKTLWGISSSWYTALGWCLVGVAIIWQIGKVIGISAADILRERFQVLKPAAIPAASPSASITVEDDLDKMGGGKVLPISRDSPLE